MSTASTGWPSARPEERLDRAVLRLALGHDLESRERHALDERRTERLRERRHVLVRRGSARRPLPHLAGAVRGLAALGERSARGARDPWPDGSVSRRDRPPLRHGDAPDGRHAASHRRGVGRRRAEARGSVGQRARRSASRTLLGQEAAIFLPTATMANQIALKLHSRPGDVLIAEEHSHVVDLRVRRRGGARGPHDARAAGSPRPRHARAGARRGRAEHEGRGPARRACSRSRTRTTAPAAGSGRSTSSSEVVATARELGLAVHLDGARLLNAAGRAGRRARRDRRALRHGDALPLEGARLPARRASRRLARADGARVAREAPVRRRDAPGGDRRRGRASTRSTITSSGSRTTTHERASLAEALHDGRRPGRPRAGRDELRPDRRRRRSASHADDGARPAAASRRRALGDDPPDGAARGHASRRHRRGHRARVADRARKRCSRVVARLAHDERRARDAAARVPEPELRPCFDARTVSEKIAVRVREPRLRRRRPAPTATVAAARTAARRCPDAPAPRARTREPLRETCASGSIVAARAGLTSPSIVSSPLCQRPRSGSSR